MQAPARSDAAQRGRWAVAAMFAANGFVTGSWAPQIPVLLERLAITETAVGLLILVFGLGAVAAMPWCGYLMASRGSRRVLRGFALAAAFGLLPVALAGSPWLAAPALFFFGGVLGGMDVAMNTNAVAAERQLGRAIMSSSHGFWSLGGFVGSAGGGLLIVQLGHVGHALAVTVLALVVVLSARGHFVEDAQPPSHARKPFRLPRNPLIYLIGLMALCSMIPEGAILDWAALYLRQERGADIALASFGFAAFSATMAATRFLGDGIRNRLGAVLTLRISSILAAAGMLVAGLAPYPLLSIAGFAFAGLGIANMVPIAFSAAGNQPGTSSSTGLSVVTTLGYSGILLAPSLIGFIGEHAGFAAVFLGLSGLLVLVFALAGLARTADFVAVERETAKPR